jgi:CheY-like chemotaxis protein
MMQKADILIIEDDNDIRESLADFLEYEGYTIVGAKNGKEGLEYLLNKDSDLPSLILLDLMMPVMDGKTFLKKLRSDHPHIQVPIVILSAILDPSVGKQVDAYMRKPVNLDDVIDKAQQFIKKEGTGNQLTV